MSVQQLERTHRPVAQPVEPEPPAHAHAHQATGKAAALLSLGALGVVYGDIGTSPLCDTVQTIFAGGHPLQPNAANVYGTTSLIVWSLVMIVTASSAGVMAPTAASEGRDQMPAAPSIERVKAHAARRCWAASGALPILSNMRAAAG